MRWGPSTSSTTSPPVAVRCGPSTCSTSSPARRSLPARLDRSTVAVLEPVIVETGRRAGRYRGGQRHRIDRARDAGLVSLLRDRDRVHRTGFALTERIRRILQRPLPRRVPDLRAVRHATRNSSPSRRPAHRVQHLQTTRLTRRPHPQGLQTAIDQNPTSTPTTPRPPTEAQSRCISQPESRYKSAHQRDATFNALSVAAGAHRLSRSPPGISPGQKTSTESLYIGSDSVNLASQRWLYTIPYVVTCP